VTNRLCSMLGPILLRLFEAWVSEREEGSKMVEIRGLASGNLLNSIHPHRNTVRPEVSKCRFTAVQVRSSTGDPG
jgi:hypothetical protein